MIAIFDVDYTEDSAVTACVCFEYWSDENSSKDLVETTFDVAPYESGSFYKRELPCIVSLISKHNLKPNIIVVDGYVWLEEEKIGLGGHLFKELDEQIPIIGVAKRRYSSHSKLREVFRGQSKNPLYITSIGIDVSESADLIKQMFGEFRLPNLIKRADQICRGTIITP
jgi:deoxyribonuclease V